MLSNIIDLIEKKKYTAAEDALIPLCDNEKAQVCAKAYYLLGYINTCYDNAQKSDSAARRYLRYNLHSDYPHPYAYVLYSKVENDTNVALNYLNKGALQFPKDPRIWREILRLSPIKENTISLIEKNEINDIQLLGDIICYLTSSQQWGRINNYVLQIQNSNNLSADEKNYLDLLDAYSCLFREHPDLTKAQNLFEQIIRNDIDNKLAYAHYLGLIYTLLKNANLPEATGYFDRLPVNNSIHDFNDGPWYFGIYIEFDHLYKTIFECISEAFSQDNTRLVKANTLYALYLYYPSEMYDIHRYKKSHAAVLARYINGEFTPEVAAALYHMRCYYRQFREAYEVFWRFIRNYKNPEEYDVFFSEIIENANDKDKYYIADQTAQYLQEENFEINCFLNNVFVELIEELFKFEQFSKIVVIAQNISVAKIIESTCAFECAYAYGEIKKEHALKIYEGLIKKEPKNSSAINNLGVIYEQNGDLRKALPLFQKAYDLDPKDLYKNNLKRIQDCIQQQKEKEITAIAEGITLKSLESIGYTDSFCNQILSIKDDSMREILSRDSRECAIAVVTGQDKLATIMCGSIIEALLMLKINELGITKYDISSISNHVRASNYTVSEMGLNELLFVADKEKLLDKSNYHLGHYIRDYRNIIHPAKELRMKQDINHDNVVVIWSVLKRLMNELLTQ